VPEDRGAARDEALLDLVGEVYALLDLEAFQPGLLQALARAIPVDWVSLNSLRQTFHSLRLYREAYTVLGWEHQVAFTLPAPAGHVLGVALSRRREEFTEPSARSYAARARTSSRPHRRPRAWAHQRRNRRAVRRKRVEGEGWYLVSTRGSHRQFKHPTKPGRVTVPGKPPTNCIPRRTRRRYRNLG